jgi:hypothetical protein
VDISSIERLTRATSDTLFNAELDKRRCIIERKEEEIVTINMSRKTMR